MAQVHCPNVLFSAAHMADTRRMATASDPLAGIRVKIERAKHHIMEVDGAVRSFLNSGTYDIATKRDPDTRKLIYYVGRVECTPLEITVITGEVINGARSV